jgi:hypothetical protein
MLVAPVLAVLVLTMIIVDASPGGVARQGEQDNGTYAPSNPPPDDGSYSPVTVRDKLNDLGRQIGQRPEANALGRYTFTHVKIWSTDDMAVDHPVTVSDEFLWWTEDRAGRRVTILTLPYAAPSAPQVQTYLPGELPVVIDRPSADPKTLADQLLVQDPPQTGAAGRLRAVSDMYTFHALDGSHRAAVLKVLADTEGLSFRGLLADRMDRTGIAVSADGQGDIWSPNQPPHRSRTTRETVILDPATAEVLSYEMVTTFDPARPNAEPYTSVYMLYVAHGHTDTMT